jgi:hypothetical protein
MEVIQAVWPQFPPKIEDSKKVEEVGSKGSEDSGLLSDFTIIQDKAEGEARAQADKRA